MIWFTAAIATLGGVLLGLALRAWIRGEARPLLAARVLVAGSALALAFHFSGGPEWVGVLAAALLLSGVALRSKVRAA